MRYKYGVFHRLSYTRAAELYMGPHGAAACGVLLAGCYAASSSSPGTLGTARPAPESGNASEPSPVDVVLQPAEGGVDGCARRAEFVPLGEIGSADTVDPVLSSSSMAMWRAVDPHSRYLYWSHEYLGDGTRTRLFRWSSEAGITAIGEFDDLFVVYISADGNVLVGSRAIGEAIGGGFRWSLSEGLTPIDFIPFALNHDGSVIVGANADGLVRWTEHAGSRVIEPGAGLSELSSLATTATLDVVAGSDLMGRAFRWTEATGSTSLGAFDEAAYIVLQHSNPSGEVLAGGAGNPANGGHAFRWTEPGGFQDLGVFSGAPEGATRWPDFVSADGRVIVGRVHQLGVSYTHPFRWTEATGMQDIVPGDRNAYATYLSPSGDVVLGYFEGDESQGFRWTEATGLQDVPGVLWPGIGADGDLLVGTNAQGPFVHTSGEFAGTQPELVRLARPGLVPDGWSETRLEGVSNDGGLLLGEALNPGGARESWLLQLRDGCADAEQ